MSDDNPFKCKHPNCGRSFTKEEHLAQHAAKHELGLNTQVLNEPEQTPTPTRGLNLGDLGDNLRLPLTSDFGIVEGANSPHENTNDTIPKNVKTSPMNPFDRAFRAATLRRSQSNVSVDSNKTIPVINNLAPQDVLRTPHQSITSLGVAESLGLTANIMQLNTGTSDLSLAGLVPLSPLPSASNQKPLLTKNSTITSFLASLGLTAGQDDTNDASLLSNISSDVLTKVYSSNNMNSGNLSPGIAIQDQNGQPQVLLLHTPQPQTNQVQLNTQSNVLTPSDQPLTMLPLSVNSGSIIQSPSTVSSNTPISAAQLYVPYLLQENGTMIPLGRLTSGGAVGAESLESPSTKRSDFNDSVDVDADNNPSIEEDAVTSSTLSLTENGSRSASAVSGEKNVPPPIPDNKDKVKEAIRRRCATSSAADCLSSAPPRKRLSLSAQEGDANDNMDGNSNRSSSSGSSTGTASSQFHSQLLNGPIRGRKALELAHKLENTKEDDRKRDQLEKKLLYLERNRAASQRSRDKKKKIMTELRDKNRVTDSRNKQLEQANLRLREEVVYLKSLLLQHIDCPKLPFQIKNSIDFKSDAVSSLILNGERSQADIASSSEFVLRPSSVGETNVVSLVSLQQPNTDEQSDQVL